MAVISAAQCLTGSISTSPPLPQQPPPSTPQPSSTLRPFNPQPHLSSHQPTSRPFTLLSNLRILLLIFTLPFLDTSEPLQSDLSLASKHLTRWGRSILIFYHPGGSQKEAQHFSVCGLYLCQLPVSLPLSCDTGSVKSLYLCFYTQNDPDT